MYNTRLPSLYRVADKELVVRDFTMSLAGSPSPDDNFL